MRQTTVLGFDAHACSMTWQGFPSARGALRGWLQASGSLSARLAAIGHEFSVQVVMQGRQPLSADEAHALGWGTLRVGYAREVLLRVDGKPMVFARSVTAFAHSVGAWRSVRGLGHRPLADVLFKRIGISRQPLEFKTIRRPSPLHCHVLQSWQKATGAPLSARALPSRRSVFTRSGAALLVMEIFVANAHDWQCRGACAIKSSKRKSSP